MHNLGLELIFPIKYSDVISRCLLDAVIQRFRVVDHDWFKKSCQRDVSQSESPTQKIIIASLNWYFRSAVDMKSLQDCGIQQVCVIFQSRDFVEVATFTTRLVDSEKSDSRPTLESVHFNRLYEKAIQVDSYTPSE